MFSFCFRARSSKNWIVFWHCFVSFFSFTSFRGVLSFFFFKPICRRGRLFYVRRRREKPYAGKSTVYQFFFFFAQEKYQFSGREKKKKRRNWAAYSEVLLLCELQHTHTPAPLHLFLLTSPKVAVFVFFRNLLFSLPCLYYCYFVILFYYISILYDEAGCKVRKEDTGFDYWVINAQ